MRSKITDRVSDGELMRRVAEGDLRAFETVYDRYLPQALAFAIRLTGQPTAAEEITQEAFLTLWRSAARYEPSRAALKTWLLLLVHSRGVDTIRRGRRHHGNVALEDVSNEYLQAAEDTEKEAVSRDESRHIRRLLTGIPSTQREVIELAYFNELTQVEIARNLDLPLGTVKGRLRLALTKLHRTLANQPPLAPG